MAKALVHRWLLLRQTVCGTLEGIRRDLELAGRETVCQSQFLCSAILTADSQHAASEDQQKMSKTPPPGAIDYEAACALLGLECRADRMRLMDDQLKKAFRKAALKAHPDKGGSDARFKVKAASNVS